MFELDEIFYSALTADTSIAEACGYVAPTPGTPAEGNTPATPGDPGTPARIYSTCIEVPPTDADNTPLPYIIITDDPLTDEQGTKDDEWESDWDSVQAGIIINAESPKEVKQLRRAVRHAIASYVSNMTENIPQLRSFNNEGISWDWTKPCYYDTLHYQCDMYIDLNDNEDDEQE